MRRIQLEIEDLATEFAAKPASIVITFEGSGANDEDGVVNFIVNGFDDVESWMVLQNLAMIQYMTMTEEEQEVCDEWFAEQDDDDD